MIRDIKVDETDSKKAKVTLLEGLKYKYEDGDKIQLKEVVGMKMEDGKSINDEIFEIK